jgi:hypothetical protein
MQEFIASGSSTTDIFGGEILGYLCAEDFSIVNIYGYGFQYDPYGGSQNGGQLAGFWLDDTAFTIDFLDSIPVDSTYYDHVYLVPEPTTLLLLGLGVLVLRRRRWAIWAIGKGQHKVGECLAGQMRQQIGRTAGGRGG